MLRAGSHSLSRFSFCDDGVYRGTRLRNKAKSGQDMRDPSNIGLENRPFGINRIYNILKHMLSTFKEITSELPFAGIFLSVRRSLWNPITLSLQKEICSTTDSPAVNIYY